MQVQVDNKSIRMKHAKPKAKSPSRNPLHQGNKGISLAPPVQKKEKNNTGLPDQLKSGIENLSGISMSDVKVHYNSSQPAQLNAHAYAQGNQIHVAPGQEKHLSHEAWHVVQQKQGRVKATMQMKGTVPVNDDKGLEKEADVMGAKMMQKKAIEEKQLVHKSAGRMGVVQGMFYEYDPDGKKEADKYIWHWGPVIPALWAEKKSGSEEQEMYKNYGVWVRKGTKAHLGQLITANERVSEAVQVARTGYQALTERLGSREQVVDQLHIAHETTKLYVDELGLALKKYATATIIGVPLIVGAAAIAQHFLSLPGVPIAVKAAIDIAGVLYGAFVTYRWMKTDLLPVVARAALAGGNTLIWANTIYNLLEDGLNGEWFSFVHIAALPLAITIEVVIRRIMAKVETMMLERSRPGGNV
jgi:hypothetical protein